MLRATTVETRPHQDEWVSRFSLSSRAPSRARVLLVAASSRDRTPPPFDDSATLASMDRSRSRASVPSARRYERPQSIPEIAVDRISASATVLQKLPAAGGARLRRSVLGQVQRALGRYNCAQLLRRSFSHVSDAGQERAFFLRFLGEGVLDNGGPCVSSFRPVFPVLLLWAHSARRTANAVGNGRAVPCSSCRYRALFQLACWDEPSGALSLFTPSRNAERAAAASGAQTHTINPRLARSGDAWGALRTVGRLVGLAQRNGVAVPMELSEDLWCLLAGHRVPRALLRGVDEELHDELCALSAQSAAAGDDAAGDAAGDGAARRLLELCSAALPDARSVLRGAPRVGGGCSVRRPARRVVAAPRPRGRGVDGAAARAIAGSLCTPRGAQRVAAGGGARALRPA